MKASQLRLPLFLLLLSGIALATLYREQLDVASIEQALHQLGALAPVIFVLLYALATIVFFPGSVLTLAGGALFGPIWGTVYNLSGATLGALLSFLIARYLAADWVEQKTRGKFSTLKQGVEAEGWRFVAFVRLVPLFPFNLLNYALGLTRIPLLHYTLASALFMLPGAMAYTYLGYVGREAAAGGSDLVQKIMLALTLLALAAFLPRLIARLRQKPMLDVAQLRDRLQQDKNLLLLDVRSAEDFHGKLGHINEALNIPLEQLAERRAELAAYSEQPIALICTTDRRSARAAKLLTRAGFADVHIVRGGMTDWRRMGFALAD